MISDDFSASGSSRMERIPYDPQVMQGIYHWLWSLGPGNPMVVRIVQGGSRRLPHLWVRMGYLGVLILLVLIGLLVGGGFSGEVALAQLAQSGTRTFAYIAYGQVVLVCLLAPLFMAQAIASEQSGKTYNILLTTPLSNLQIVLGSLLGRLFFVLALLASGLPLFSVLLVFGGVPITSVLASFLVASLTALAVGAVAITLSVLRLGGRKAVFSFVILAAAFLFGGYALDALLLRELPMHQLPGGGRSTTWLTPLHPLLVMESQLNTANYRPVPAELMADRSTVVRHVFSRPLWVFSLITLGGTGGLVIFCAGVLRRIGQGESRLMMLLAEKFRLSRFGDEGGERVRSGGARRIGRNPIAWREAHTRGRNLGSLLARYGFLVLGLAGGIGLVLLRHFERLPQLATGDPDQLFRGTLLTLLLMEVALITLVAIYMSAGCVSREREDGTLDIMLTTPITPRYYIWGKLQGLVRFLGLMIVTPLLTVTLVSLYSLIGRQLGWEQATWIYRGITSQGAQVRREVLLMQPEAVLLLALMLIPFVAICVATGMNWSLKSRGVLGAVSWTVAIITPLALVSGLCGYGAATQIPLVGPVINAFSPTTNLLMLVDPWSSVAGFAENPLVGRASVLVGALLTAAGYSLIVYALILGMVRGFDQTVRKLSGGR